MENKTLLIARDIKKNFYRAGKNSNYFTAVENLDFDLKAGLLTEITGRSGSGKSTLLNMFAGLLTPSQGKIFIDDKDIYSLSEDERSILRNKKIGLIPQGHTALLSLSVLENVLLPYILYNKDTPPVEKATEMLEKVGLASLMNSKPNELSGGELRRLAIARAMLMESDIILADEPTAGLDTQNTIQVLTLLKDAAKKGSAVLLITHEEEAKNFADKIYTMDGGRLN
ncbi:MAG: ABC transporter ATP-binding protein [Treponema sp.]|nr:ABC transporter ATP-binding protein [Treponema sp.]